MHNPVQDSPLSQLKKIVSLISNYCSEENIKIEADNQGIFAKGNGLKLISYAKALEKQIPWDSLPEEILYLSCQVGTIKLRKADIQNILNECIRKAEIGP